MSTNKNFKRREAARRRNAEAAAAAGSVPPGQQQNAPVPGYAPVPDQPSTTAPATPAVAMQPTAALVPPTSSTVGAQRPLALPVLPQLPQSGRTQVPISSTQSIQNAEGSGTIPRDVVSGPSAVNAQDTVSTGQGSLSNQQSQAMPLRPASATSPGPRPSRGQLTGKTPVDPQPAMGNSGISLILQDDKPTPGTSGEACMVKTNHFKTDVQMKKIFKYVVSVTPQYTVKRTIKGEERSHEPTLTPRKRRRVLYLLMQLPEFRSAATDYKEAMVSIVDLACGEESKQWTIDLLDEGVDQRPTGQASKPCDVVLTKLAPSRPSEMSDKSTALDIANLNRYLAGDTGACDEFEEIMRALNLLASSIPSQQRDLTRVGATGTRFFPQATDNKTVKNLGGGLEARTGFSRSMRALEGGVFFQVNTAASAFYRPLRLSELLDEWAGPGPFNSEIKQQKQDNNDWELSQFVRGLRVRRTYGNREVCSVWDFSEATDKRNRPTPEQVEFSVIQEDGSRKIMTVAQYFKEKYNLKSNVKNVCVMNVGTENHPVSVPCDLLEVMHGNRFIKVLPGTQTGLMVKFAARPPKENCADIESRGMSLFKIQKRRPFDLADRFSLSVTPEMLQVHARMLPMPKLIYTSSKGANVLFNPPVEWNWRLEGYCFPGVGKQPKCIPIVLHYGRTPDRDAQQWHRAMKEGLRKFCGASAQLAPLETLSLRSSDDRSTLTNKFQTLVHQKKANLAFVLLPYKDAKLYDNVKYAADYHAGIHTVCTAPFDGNYKVKPEYIENEILKVNLKMGGVNTKLSMATDSAVRDFLNSTTMIVGADVTHPGPGSVDNTDSIAAVVATYEGTFSQYPASLRCQTSKKEMIEKLDEMLEERLLAWQRLRPQGDLPDQIVFFRDGVSESQFDQVGSEEVPLIEKALNKVYGARNAQLPKLLLLCVVKRVHTRFFPQPSTMTDRSGNSNPGLVVDTVITYPRGTDFYMQSQRAIKGTAKPNHYVVLVNDIGVSMDTLQKAIFWQCFTYPTSLTPVGVHPAARLADRACTRGRSYLREFLVKTRGSPEGMDRGTNASHAWRHGVHANLEDSTFYV